MTQNTSNNSDDFRPAAERRSRRFTMLIGSISAIVVCLVIRHYWQAEPAKADTQAAASRSTRTQTRPATRATAPTRSDAKADPASSPAEDNPAAQIVATVNTQRITRRELAAQCRRAYGQEVLESMVNKRLITEECQRQGVNVTRAEVDAEIERMAKRFNIPVDQWLKLLKQERNITPTQYANDIIWPTLAPAQTGGRAA